ncbi:MAG: transglutaminase-like cysteine peptidase [Sulfurimonas sp.]|jgi:predicted transglutaminase-like cysteine proteinase|nr:transglutaminase-like cysteine peptidase [Sulfurimonas sp.]
MKKFFASLFLCFIIVNTLYADLALDPKLLEDAEKKYGPFAKNRFIDLRDEVLGKLQNADEIKKLNVVNTWFNFLKYKSDQKNYNESDYWANLYEFIGRGSGDCEDYVIGKYYTLKALGVDPKKLKFAYVIYQDRAGKSISHMVLAYLKVPNPKTKDDYLILDNTNRKLLPASKRADITKVIRMINGDTGPKSKKWQQLELDMKRKKL